MKLKVLLCCLFVVGFGASYALAGNGHGNGAAKKKDPTTSSSSSSSSTTATTASKKTLLCHKTHSAKNPYVLISISSHAVAAHLRHGDVVPTAGKCPAAAATTTSTTTTTTNHH